MKIYDFICISKAEQVQLLQKEGVYLADRVEEGREIKLFALGDFYVEVVSTTGEELTILRTFKTCTRLEPYLDGIDLVAIFA